MGRFNPRSPTFSDGVSGTERDLNCFFIIFIQFPAEFNLGSSCDVPPFFFPFSFFFFGETALLFPFRRFGPLKI